MSMVINLVEDHNIYLCEGGPVYNGGVQPAPITYLTQWKIVGNSEVHTLPYPDGVVLPNGYKRCEYLESDGTAYIELPFGFDVTDKMYAKVKFNNTYNEERHIISLKDWNTDKNASSRFCFAEAYINSVNSFSSALGNVPVTLNGGFTPNALFNLSVCEISYRNKRFTLLNEGNTFVRNLISTNFGPETSHIVLLQNYDNTGTEGAIYEYRHRKGNTKYLLIPCLDSNDTPCMYDVINNQAYYNSAESGSFTYKLYPQPTEIWSCGEYNPTDGKYHILVQPLGGSIADIALDEPLRKVNDVADTIEFSNGVATVTRNIATKLLKNMSWAKAYTDTTNIYRWSSNGISNLIKGINNNNQIGNILCTLYDTITANKTWELYVGIALEKNKYVSIYDERYTSENDKNALITSWGDAVIIYELATPITELVDAPQIAEAESYSMVISQGGKAVEWSSFTTE